MSGKKKELIAPRVVGHSIEHSVGTDDIKHTAIGAGVVHGQLRLAIGQGNAKVLILAKDWEFFKKQADELLGKRRLLESANT